jgi:hypothetical protein
MAGIRRFPSPAARARGRRSKRGSGRGERAGKVLAGGELWASAMGNGGDGTLVALGGRSRSWEVREETRKVSVVSVLSRDGWRGGSTGGRRATAQMEDGGSLGGAELCSAFYRRGREEEGDLGLLSYEEMAGTGTAGAWRCRRPSSACTQGDSAAWRDRTTPGGRVGANLWA